MQQIRTKNNHVLHIRPLTTTDAFAGGHGLCPINCRMTNDGECLSSDVFEKLNTVMMENNGTTAILALDGTVIAGFVSFFPTWCPHFNFCDDAEIADAMTHLDETTDVPQGVERALHVRCLAIRPDYQGNGLAVALLEHLKKWAREHNWATIVGNGNIYSGRAKYQWLVSPKPPVPIWEKAGFVISDFRPLNMKGISPEASARGARDWYFSDQFPAQLPRDITIDDPDWREIFADYTMVWRI